MSSLPIVYFEQPMYDLVAGGHAAWLIAEGAECRGVYSNRESARGAKSSGVPGKIMRASEIRQKLKQEPEAIPVIVTEPNTEETPKDDTPKEIVHASSVERPCKLVWHIADELKISRPNARRAEILAECVSRGVAYFTARTQYQQWLGIQKEMAEREAQQKVPATSK